MSEDSVQQELFATMPIHTSAAQPFRHFQSNLPMLLKLSKNRDELTQIINQMSSDELQRLDETAIKYYNKNVDDPIEHALAENQFGKAYYARFLLLQELQNIQITPILSSQLAQELNKFLSPKLLKELLIDYNQELLASFLTVFDNNNLNLDTDKLGWCIVRTDKDGLPTTEVLTCLHEDLDH